MKIKKWCCKEFEYSVRDKLIVYNKKFMDWSWINKEAEPMELNYCPFCGEEVKKDAQLVRKYFESRR